MNIVWKILAALASIIGTMGAIKSLLPTDITYEILVKNMFYMSGWIIAFIFCLVLIYQEAKFNNFKKQITDLNSESKAHDKKMISILSDDKEYLKSELTNSTKILRYFSANFEIHSTPIPKRKDSEAEDEF
ncbi:hypothetical protein [Shewanella sp. Iso12]|uniref:hypothetical protein n=1 Tax=Shewanella sp. Iso12 TaxID=1826753 RepID=UPI001430D87B|nr:hypothetical protein [Shewanella sp. Iso12]NJI85522.1 hypothetical protein [Shewanella sp. Iso12]